MIAVNRRAGTWPSKGVCCPHGQFFWWGLNTSHLLEIEAGDVLCTTLPLFHTNALNTFFQALITGATAVFEPRFSGSAASPIGHGIEKHRASNGSDKSGISFALQNEVHVWPRRRKRATGISAAAASSGSKGGIHRSTIDQQILADDESRIGAAQEGAGLAKLLGGSEASGGNF